MKKVFLTAFLVIIIDMSFNILVAQSSKLSYPAATKYAKVLYAIEVNTRKAALIIWRGIQ